MKNFLVIFSILISIGVITSEFSEYRLYKRGRGGRRVLRQIVSPIGEETPYPTETTTEITTPTKRPQACIAKPSCIPRPICEPQVQCRQRPVQLPACEDLSAETTYEPVQEDIVQITQTELPYCEYRRYCAPQPKIQYCEEPPVTITPPKVTPPTPVPPKVIKCGLLSICCWEGLNLLPESFWLNKDLETGRDFIAIGNNGKYLSADEEGKITIKENVGESELFRITKVATGIVHIMSYYGGYLTIKEDGSVDAITRTICDDNFIHIIYSKNNCNGDEINYIALRAINGKYLTILENEAASVDKIAATTEIFKGYLFDEKNSKCYGQEPEMEVVQEEEDKKEEKVEDKEEEKVEDKEEEKVEDDLVTSLKPTETIIPQQCLDLADKIISIECKVIMDKIKKDALTTLSSKRRQYRR